VQIGIGGWQVPREAIAVARDTTIITMSDAERLGVDKVPEIALEIAWKDADAVYLSFDIDSVDCGFVPGTGWPESGGFLPREALGLVGRVAREGLFGMEIVEFSPPYDTSDITALFATRVIVDALGAIVASGKLAAHRPVIDKPATSLRREQNAAVAGRGDNAGFRAVSQWQDPKTDEMSEPQLEDPDLDLVEQEFYRSALTCADPASLFASPGSLSSPISAAGS
jgi:agmatinase